VPYMRASVYMHGQSRNPRWDELKTSLVVASVALGVGFGSPLAGYLSGGKIELGLVPVGCIGMILATFSAGLAIEHTGVLVAALVVIGFFSGFYMVPLYTLLQHRAPKASKGDLIATSNFINVTGAITASLLFFALVKLAHYSGVVPLAANQNSEFARGELKVLERVHGRPTYFEIKQADGTIWRFGKPIAASVVARSPDRATNVDEDDDWFDEEEAEKEPI